MRTLLRLTPPLLALLLAACGHIDVKTQHDASAARAAGGYRTYAWKPPSPGEEQHAFSPGTHVSVEKSVDAYLQSRGYQRVEASATPDFLIRWGGALTGTVIRMEGLSQGPREPPMDPMDPRRSTSEGLYTTPSTRPRPVDTEVPKGVLDLDILDAGTRKPVWHGRAQGELSEGAKEGDVQVWLDKAVSKLLADFPPETGKH